jgi:hypothetical protein
MNDQNNSRETRITYGSIDPNVVASLKPSETTQYAKKTSVNNTRPSQDDTNVPERVEAHRKILESFEMEKAARSVSAPTLDNDVKTRLREFGEPICLFGEGVGISFFFSLQQNKNFFSRLKEEKDYAFFWQNVLFDWKRHQKLFAWSIPKLKHIKSFFSPRVALIYSRRANGLLVILYLVL